MTSQGFGKTKPQIVSSYLLRSKVDRKDELWGWKWTKDKGPRSIIGKKSHIPLAKSLAKN